ncbi:MAG: SMI1/KNR4 family protein [Isosphaeraceae bacterium]|nr:SMI1/KNR4 family protein [Isosphaeraceae bacterium]
MLERLNPSFRLLLSSPAATPEQLRKLEAYFGHIPAEFRELCQEATDLEFKHDSGQELRILGPEGCIELDEAFDVRANLPGAYLIGDDCGGHMVMYYEGDCGPGVYQCDDSVLEPGDMIWVAPSLSALLCDGEGVTRLALTFDEED